jgi:ferredoxin
MVSKEADIPCELRDIGKSDRRNIPEPEKDSMIGFVGPTHGFNFPPIMFHFILRFPGGKKNPVFIFNTRAGMKLHKLFLPGLSGMALYFNAILLRLKGYRLQALKSVDLPSNWISIHPGIRKKVVDSMIEREKRRTKVFAGKILEGKRVFRGLIPLPIDLAITPIAFLYYLIGRFFLAKTFFASHDCSDCGLCDQSCPVKAIKIVDKRRYWTWRCESCMQCMNKCPERAIETAHGFVAIVIFLLSGVVLIKLNKWLGLPDFFDRIFPGKIAGYIEFAVDNIILVMMIFVAYRILHFLLRYRFFERLFVYTSLTHLKFWRRYRVKWKQKV